MREIGLGVWLVFWSLPAIAAGICDRPLSVGWDEWPPFHYQGRDGEPDGYAVQLFKLAADKLGCRLVYRLMPWPRTLQQLRLGQVDAAMQALRTPEREAYACFAPGYSPTIVRLWARRDRGAKWTIRDIADLGRQGPLHLGVTRGDSYGAEVDRWLQAPPPNVRIDVGETLAVSMRKLQLGRIDLLLATMSTASRELARLPPQPAIAPLAPTWRAGEGYYAFSRNSVPEPLCQAFARTLQALRQDGTVERLYRSQFGEPYPAP
ncbi:substrate-binding periplasmic protein [Chromobacterium sp. CV08]|uniref:substrate-binding periplasmic protein n=1 Tax=Chromobacterium sp. CV08 TaxID=3133274 RepID=UPI003DA872D9